MACLTYTDEHLAWKQRIHQQIFRANSNINLQTQIKDKQKQLKQNLFPKIQRSKTISPSRQYVKYNKFKDLSSVNVYAQVRGKYSRRMQYNKTPTKFSEPTTETSKSDRSIIRTSSVKTRNFIPKSCKSDEQKTSKRMEKSPQKKNKNTDKLKEINLGTSEQSRKVPRAFLIPEKLLSRPQTQANSQSRGSNREVQQKKEIHQQEQNQEELSIIDQQEQEQETQSFMSSQNAYIKQLQQLLKEQIRKRKELEQQLQSLTSN